jgi:hypothetical protein
MHRSGWTNFFLLEKNQKDKTIKNQKCPRRNTRRRKGYEGQSRVNGPILEATADSRARLLSFRIQTNSNNPNKYFVISVKSIDGLFPRFYSACQMDNNYATRNWKKVRFPAWHSLSLGATELLNSPT